MAIITASDLKTHLGITDSVDDTTIGSAVNAANAAVTEWCGRTFDKTAIISASARVFRATSPGCVTVDDFWETSALVVKTDDGDTGTYETTWTIDTDFILEPTNGLLNGQTWPYNRIVAVGGRIFPTWNRRPGVQITAAWGWTAVPAAVFEATLIKAARLFKRKNSPEGVLGGFADFGAVRISNREDPDVAALLGPYRRGQRAAVIV